MKWFDGVATTLLRKTTLVTAGPDRLPVHTLTFQIPSQPVASPAIPHANIRLDLGQVVKMVIPGYKPKSYSVSALRDTEFDVTFKVYPNGRASGYLDRLQVGDTIHSFGKPNSRYRNAGKRVGIIAYGVGMTEALPVARAELDHGSRVTLLWASRTLQDTFWKDQTNALHAQYPQHFRLKHILSRQQDEDCLHGRINADILQQVFHKQDDYRFLVVGTKEMMSNTYALLESIGYPMPQHELLPKVAK